MRNKFHNLEGQRGVTITEVIIVLLIIAVVASLALMSMDTSNTRFKRQNVARELKVAFERARFDSVKRHAEGAGPATVVVDAGSYTLNTDSDRNGTYETQVTTFASDITIAPYVAAGDPAFTLPITVSFDSRGEATAPGSVKPRFYICNGSCSSPSSTNADLLLVTPTGTVNLLGGDSTPPTFASANVTSISNTAGISNLVSLP